MIMDFENIKEKISKKHIIIGTSALIIVAGGITAGVIASNSDEQPVNAPVVTEPTTEVVTTAVTTTTAKTTTTKVTTTTVATTTKKADKKKDNKDKTDSSSKTEVSSNDNSNDYSYEEPAYEYEEPAYQEPAQQETPKQEEPKQPEPEPVPEPEPEPEPVYDTNSPEYFGLSGSSADLFNYAISQGCDGYSAVAYVSDVQAYGQSNVLIGNPAPDNPNSYWAIWYTTDGGITWNAG